MLWVQLKRQKDQKKKKKKIVEDSICF